MLLLCFLPLISQLASASNPIAVPAVPSFDHVVDPNFFGISFELSFMDEYFGNDTSSIPQTMINYLKQIRSRTGSKSLRLRVGGNSADSSNYVPSQTEMVTLTDPNANANDQPVNYGPELWHVMKQVADSVGGVQYLIGLSLNDSSGQDAVVAGAAKQVLGDSLDAMLLGNEPDLYTAHGERPGLQNYTVQDYINEFGAVRDHLKSTSAGDLVSSPSVAGPTICCAWDLASLLGQGYLSTFDSVLKYVTLQHYPQNNCFGTHEYELSYYLQHANAVGLAAWQKPGIDIVLSDTSAVHPQMVLSEFNTASCGGVPGISDTFGATLWTVDYVLQLAAIGYSAAFIHTREKGISYNLVTPADDLLHGPWHTNPPFYSLITTAEVLQSDGGVKVVDMDVNGSKTNPNITVAGYAVYDAKTSSLSNIVLFNFDSQSTQFTLSGTNGSSAATVKYLAAPSVQENQSIAWAGETFLGVGDGNAIPAPSGQSWALPNKQIDCSKGCAVDVPGPGLAVVSFAQSGEPTETSSGSPAQTSSTQLSQGGAASRIKPAITLLGFIAVLWMLLL